MSRSACSTAAVIRLLSGCSHEPRRFAPCSPGHPSRHSWPRSSSSRSRARVRPEHRGSARGRVTFPLQRRLRASRRQTCSCTTTSRLPSECSSPARVVHYVGVGISAPPLNDDDANAVPDYVERVAQGGGHRDRLLRAGLLQGDPVPLGRPGCAAGRLRLALHARCPRCRTSGDARAGRRLRGRLERSGPERAGELRKRVRDGRARAVPSDPVLVRGSGRGPAVSILGARGDGCRHGEPRPSRARRPRLGASAPDAGIAATQRSITTQTYGAQRLWHHLDRRYPRLLDAYLERLGRSSTGEGLRELVETFRAVTGTRFGPAFHRFALDVAGRRPRAGRRAIAGSSPRGRTRASVAPLAIHYVRLSVPKAGSYELRVRLATGGAGTDTRVSLVYQLESEIARASEPRGAYRFAPLERWAGADVPHSSRPCARTLASTRRCSSSRTAASDCRLLRGQRALSRPGALEGDGCMPRCSAIDSDARQKLDRGCAVAEQSGPCRRARGARPHAFRSPPNST